MDDLHDDLAAHVADELANCDHQWVMIRPSRPGPDGWAKRCARCGAYVDISAEARAEAEAEFMERTMDTPANEVESPACVGTWAMVTLNERRETQAGRIVASDALGVTLRRKEAEHAVDVFFPWARVFCIERITNRETIHRIVMATSNARVWLLPREQKYRFDDMGWW